jgi:hypothetical protein
MTASDMAWSQALPGWLPTGSAVCGRRFAGSALRALSLEPPMILLAFAPQAGVGLASPRSRAPHPQGATGPFGGCAPAHRRRAAPPGAQPTRRKARSLPPPCCERRVRCTQRSERAFHNTARVANAPFATLGAAGRCAPGPRSGPRPPNFHIECEISGGSRLSASSGPFATSSRSPADRLGRWVGTHAGSSTPRGGPQVPGCRRGFAKSPPRTKPKPPPCPGGIPPCQSTSGGRQNRWSAGVVDNFFVEGHIRGRGVGA